MRSVVLTRPKLLKSSLNLGCTKITTPERLSGFWHHVYPGSRVTDKVFSVAPLLTNKFLNHLHLHPSTKYAPPGTSPNARLHADSLKKRVAKLPRSANPHRPISPFRLSPLPSCPPPSYRYHIPFCSPQTNRNTLLKASEAALSLILQLLPLAQLPL